MRTTDQAKGKSERKSSFPDDPAALLPRYHVLDSGTRSLTLPDELYELSGLAFSSDGLLFGHNDEQGIVYQIDPAAGTITRSFTLGASGVNDDFEEIAIVGERFFLLSSKGDLYEFREGADRAAVNFTKIKTGLSAKYDLEGLCYDPATNALLIACKEYPGKDYKDGEEKTVYGFSLEKMKLEPKPRFVIPAKEIAKELKLRNFKPSGIARHPETGSFFLLSSNEPAIIEISAEGKILAIRSLPPSAHKQPEGIAIDRKGTLFIGNEGGKIVEMVSR